MSPKSLADREYSSILKARLLPPKMLQKPLQSSGPSVSGFGFEGLGPFKGSIRGPLKGSLRGPLKGSIGFGFGSLPGP